MGDADLRNMNSSDIEAIVKGIAPAIREYVAEALKPLAARIKALEEAKANGFSGAEKKAFTVATGRVIAAEIDKRIKGKGVGLRYRGVWQASDEYALGDFATLQGALWHCCSDSTRERPGTSSAWQLAVKADK
jgi:hypothetical protein